MQMQNMDTIIDVSFFLGGGMEKVICCLLSTATQKKVTMLSAKALSGDLYCLQYYSTLLERQCWQKLKNFEEDGNKKLGLKRVTSLKTHQFILAHLFTACLYTILLLFLMFPFLELDSSRLGYHYCSFLLPFFFCQHFD